MYRVEGDGSYEHTKIWCDNEELSFNHFTFMLSIDEGIIIIDEDVIQSDQLESLIIKGVYTIISQGKFINTRIWIFDEQLRGVQSITITIGKDDHSHINVDSILLPNLVEVVNS